MKSQNKGASIRENTAIETNKTGNTLLDNALNLGN